MSEIRKCKISGKEFKISDDDIKFYNQINVPLPTLCPEERQRRRLIWRNERHLYQRNCDLCKKNIISIYSRDCEFPIYCESCFWSEKWDPLNYGIDFDFAANFFEQLEDLFRVVPKLAITHANSVNSDYTLNSIENKNCYLTSGADYNENCHYGISSQRSKDCIDTFLIYDSESSYGSLDSSKIFNCIGCQNCENVSNSWFLYDCINCKDCAFSSNLRNTQYVLFNKKLDKEEYKKELSKKLKEYFENPDWLHEGRMKVKDKAIKHKLIVNSDQVTGDYVRNCRNSSNIFDAENLENCKFAFYATAIKDSYDISCVSFNCKNLYEVMSACNGHDVFFSNASLYSHDAEYCVTCFDSAYIFGSISLKSDQYVILNKQYSKEDYEIMKQKIIRHMKETKEYGEFFPSSLSPFQYNRSSAIDYMPLTKEEANILGYLWQDNPNIYENMMSNVSVKCEACNNFFNLVDYEMNFYKKKNIPFPKFCWACRLRKIIDCRAAKEIS